MLAGCEIHDREQMILQAIICLWKYEARWKLYGNRDSAEEIWNVHGDSRKSHCHEGNAGATRHGGKGL